MKGHIAVATGAWALACVMCAASGPTAQTLAQSGAPRIVDAARMAEIAFATREPGPWKGARPARSVDANRYEQDGLAPLAPRLAPRMANPDAARQTEAWSREAVQAFDYTLASDVDFAGPAQNGYTPADCHVAAGFSHVIAVVNSDLRVFDRTGAQLYSTTLDALLGTAAGWSGCFDPKVRFDAVRNRFYLLALDRHNTLAQASYRLAISIGPDPTLGWYVWEMRNEQGGLGIDYEELGFGPRGLYLTGNFLRFSGWPAPSASQTGSCWVMDLGALVAGGNTSIWRFDDLRGTLNEKITTAKTTASGEAAPAGLDAITIGQGNHPDGVQRRAVFWGWSLPANFPTTAPTAVQRSLDIAGTNAIPDATQSGGAGKLKANNIGGAFLGAFLRNGRVVGAMTIETSGAANVRSYEFDLGAWPTVTQTNTVDLTGAPSYHHFWPNTARNDFGEQLLVYSRSGSSEFVGSRWALRQRDQSTFPQSGVVADGAGYVGRPMVDTADSTYRWGDYSGADIDPGDQGFWVFDSFASNSGTFGTRLRHIPHVEFVDNTVATSNFGTRTNPRSSLETAAFAARPRNPIVIRAGTYSVTTNFTFSTATELVPDGGAVTIVAP